MLCPNCSKDIKSKVTLGQSTSTLNYNEPFYDEEGKYHLHDTNRRDQEYSCSHGHKGTIVSYGSCWCGWNNYPVPLK